MPASSRLTDLFGISSPLRRTPLLLPGPAGLDGWPTIGLNGIGGGYLTAVADPDYGRIRVDLYWPGIRSATIVRVHADGSAYPVRGGDPATMATGWARYDYEAPLDQAVTYQATSVERAGAVTTTGPVTCPSGGRFWLKNLARPALNLRVTVKERGSRKLPDRRGIARPPSRPDPIIVHQIRGQDEGWISLYAPDQAAETALRTLLADGSPVLLQYPGAAGGESLYLSIGQVGPEPLSRQVTDPKRALTLEFDSMTRPPGSAAGDPDAAYALIPTAYQTYNQLAAGETTYLELSMSPG